MARMDIREETGTTADSIAQYLLQQQNFNNVPKQYRVRLENWLINENGQNNYDLGMSITIPNYECIKAITFIELPSKTESYDGSTYVPNPEPSGWTLTKDGRLLKGKTGYFIDENGLYILKDGRRLDKTRAEGASFDKTLCVGADDITAGLKDILGTENLSDVADISLNECTNFDAYHELFMRYGKTMCAVVYQAFQINKVYPTSESEWIYTPYNNVFKRIGYDETDIPIVVTRVGFENATTKTVLAAPHGDERTAQRLIMHVQKLFEDDRAKTNNNEAIYFIPSISPTLTFADARGIPNGLWQQETGKLTETIPSLHDTMTNAMRSIIQSQERAYQHGVDANRDPDKKLVSTQAFIRFIEDQKNRTNRLSNGSIAAVMIHGYMGYNNAEHGATYVQYEIDETKNTARVLPANERLGDLINEQFGWSTQTDGHIYSTTPTNQKMYDGEHIRLLKTLNIRAVDIELGKYYNEGIRGSERGYDPDNINRCTDLEEQFAAFLKNTEVLHGTML